MKKKVEIRLRHWVYIDDKKFLGPGRIELLEYIQETGSISKAAKNMGLSYKKAWTLVDEMNTYGKTPYVVTQKGGTKGGGTVVTETGKQVMAAYKTLNDHLLKVVKAEKALLELI